MKVRVSFSLEVDVEKWAEEYGVDKSEVRRDITRYAEQAMLSHIEDLALGVDR